jgi:predicted AlkP superfamily pyrophosphatase or phosphodiesterase
MCALFATLLAIPLAGCTPPDCLDLTLQSDVVRPPKTAIIFLVDGMDLTRLEELLAAGELPNIQHRFVEGGVRVRDAMSSLPSVTYPNCTSVITGLFPGHHGIMGRRERSA